MNRNSQSATILMISVLVTMLAAAISAASDTVDVAIGWAPSPVEDDNGLILAPSVKYEVYVRRGNEVEEMVATVSGDTVYTLAAHIGVVHRVRVVGYDADGRRSLPSEWSMPIYFDAERNEGPYSTLPADPTIGNVFPNPFNPETSIEYSVPVDIPDGTPMMIEVYNIRGEHIRTLDVDQEPGWHEVMWNGLDDTGRMQATGTYVTRYICGNDIRVAKMTMVK